METIDFPYLHLGIFFQLNFKCKNLNFLPPKTLPVDDADPNEKLELLPKTLALPNVALVDAFVTDAGVVLADDEKTEVELFPKTLPKMLAVAGEGFSELNLAKMFGVPSDFVRAAPKTFLVSGDDFVFKRSLSASFSFFSAILNETRLS
jgi:hypothetical protein